MQLLINIDLHVNDQSTHCIDMHFIPERKRKPMANMCFGKQNNVNQI